MVVRVVVLVTILVAESAVAAAEGSAVGMDVQLAHFAAQGGASLQVLAAHEAEPLFVAGRAEAVGHRDPHECWSDTGTDGLDVLQTLLVGHEVTHFTKEANQSPYEIATVVAECRFG